MPPLDLVLRREVDEALDLVRAGELSRLHSVASAGAPTFKLSRLEFLYEVAYLRVFVSWENFLEQSLLRYMCGFASSRFGLQTLVAPKYFGSIADAQLALYRGQDFLLWHNAQRVEKRAAAFINGGRHEVVVASAGTTLTHLASIRHRVAHGQADAAMKCDAATIHFAARRYKGARPGRFLRDFDRSVLPERRWLESLGSTLCSLAGQIV